ncbi:MAG: hypothetical protein K1X78_22235 [Verrucomicrobiaceae bacterium]|nr:hypothetical protein [Verrucomicrobiaceae bacterium]
MTTARATLLLARAQYWALLHRGRIGMRENRLLSVTIAAFLGVYAVASYLLVARGIEFVHKLPLLGPLLTERLVFLLFFFFFVMLVISNATITGMGLFRKRETGWQVALPIPARSLVLWKTIEGMLLASWGLVVLSAPILAALGRMFDAGMWFYLANMPALLCLVTISANLSTWLLLAVVRWARRWWWWPAGILATAVFVPVVYQVWFTSELMLTPGDIAGNVNQILKHTQICTHPLLPSSWVSEAILASGRPMAQRALFFNLVLLSHALVSLLVTGWLAARWFYPSWNRMMAAGGFKRVNDAAAAWFRQSPVAEAAPRFMRLLGFDRASCAMLSKDIRTFLREPAQWGQSALIFGLLFFYTSNLRRLGYDLGDPLWSVVLSYLNLMVCCLSISTLTTRFIFPQFSLEGQRLWILGLSPVPMERMLVLKLRLNGSVMALLTTTLILVSSITISLPWHRILFFVTAMTILSYGLTALALALGTLLPNFREQNPAKIVSGFGGTLCLISSFLYILTGIGVLIVPALAELRPEVIGLPARPVNVGRWECTALSGLALVSMVFGALPYGIAKRNTKKLVYLTNL